MKQEIVIRVQMNCDKCRTKAMEVVASAKGVDSVSLTGDERNQLVVVGDGVDSVNLASILRRKVGRADIIKVGEPKKIGNKDGEDKEKGKDKYKEKKNGSEKEKEKEKTKTKDENKVHIHHYQYNEPKMEYGYQWYPSYPPPSYPPPPMIMYESPSNSNPDCSIM